MSRKIIVFGLSDAIGGTENYLLNMQRLLWPRLTFMFFSEFAQNRHAEQILAKHGEIVYVPREFGIRKYVTTLYRELKHYRKETDTLYLNLSNYSHYRLFLFIIAVSLKYRIIIHAHGARLNHVPNQFRAITHQITRVLSRLFTKHFTRIAVSDRAGRFIFGKQSFDVLWAGIDLEKYAFSETVRNKMREQCGCGGRTVIGFVGRMVEVKNPEFAVHVFRSYCDIIGKEKTLLLMIGDGPLLEEVRALVRKLDLEENTMLVGASNEVDKYLQEMDCIIATSFSEGMPLGIMEAQAAALPCLCAEGRFPHEIKVTELVEMLPLENGADEWAKKLVDMLSKRHSDRAKWLQEHKEVLLSLNQDHIAERLFKYLNR